MLRKTTLLFLVDEGRLLLALKKRGLGVGKLNGAGGKQDGDEAITATATREMREELGLAVPEDALALAGVLEFRFPARSEWDSECHVFTAPWRPAYGTPTETEEMAPRWVDLNDIPYHSMWPDDAIWLPRVLAGDKGIHYRFWHNAQTSEILRYECVQ